MEGQEKGLTDKQRRFVNAYAAGEDKLHAALAAGYQKGSGAKKAGSRLLKNQAVKREVEAIQQAGRAAAGKTLADRIAQADEDRAFARAKGNAMAAHKSTELQCRLEGYLIERVAIEHIDLSGSLARAAARVIEINPAYKHILEADAQADETKREHPEVLRPKV